MEPILSSLQINLPFLWDAANPPSPSKFYILPRPYFKPVKNTLFQNLLKYHQWFLWSQTDTNNFTQPPAFQNQAHHQWAAYHMNGIGTNISTGNGNFSTLYLARQWHEVVFMYQQMCTSYGTFCSKWAGTSSLPGKIPTRESATGSCVPGLSSQALYLPAAGSGAQGRFLHSQQSSLLPVGAFSGPLWELPSFAKQINQLWDNYKEKTGL